MNNSNKPGTRTVVPRVDTAPCGGNPNPTTKMVVPRVDTAPDGVETPTWGSWSQRHPGRIISHPRIRNTSIHVQLQQRGTKTVVTRGDTTPHGVDTPIWGSWSQRHPGRIISHPRIRNFSINLQLRNENGGHPGRYRPPRCGNPNVRFVKPAPPWEDKISSSDHKYFNRNENRGPPSQQRFARCGYPNLGFVERAPPGQDKTHPRIRNPCIQLQLQQTGDENGGPPGRYRPARCGNAHLGFVEPVPPGQDKVPSPDQKSFHKSTTEGRKR